jgi:hypothetical protein
VARHSPANDSYLTEATLVVDGVEKKKIAQIEDGKLSGLIGKFVQIGSYHGVAFPAIDEPADLGPVELSFGDLVMSRFALPSPDNIISGSAEAGWKPGETVNVSPLLDYLRFLEIVVLHERVLVAGVDALRGLREEGPEHPDYDDGFGSLMSMSYDNDLDLALFQLLADNGIYRTCFFNYDSYKPEFNEKIDGLAELYSEDMQSGLDWFEGVATTPVTDDVAAAFKRYWLHDRISSLLAIQAIAGSWRVPHVLADREITTLRQIDEFEAKAQFGVVEFLKESLDSGARELAAELSALRGAVDFPWTPIATQVLLNSDSLEALPRIALEFRDAFSAFRREALYLQRELDAEAVSLRKRRRLISEVHEMAKDLWPAEEGVMQKTIRTVADVSSIPGLTSGTLPDIADTAARLAKVRPDSLRRILRRRKTRALINARKDFLAAKNLNSHVAAVCRVPVGGLKYSLLKAGASS